MKQDTIYQVTREAARRVGAALRGKFRAEELCRGNVPQLAAVQSTAKRKVLCCGRRAGKTVGIAIALLLMSLSGAGARCLYITLTRGNAEEILFEALDDLNQRYGLGGVWNLTKLTLVLPNGSQIQLRGCHTEREIAKYRGKRYHFVVIDEMQSIPQQVLQKLIEMELSATLVDFGADMWLAGTRSPVRSGYWFDCYAGTMAANREQHSWSVLDNERLPVREQGNDIEAVLAAVRAEYGWTEDHPTYQREFLNRDVEDTEALLYWFRPDLNTYTTLPSGGKWNHVVGIDVGTDDSDAVAVVGWRTGTREVYLLKEHVRAGQDVTDLAEVVHTMIKGLNVVGWAIDTGGLGKKVAIELQKRHGLPVTAADKAQKGAAIELFNRDARRGLIKFPPGSRWVSDRALVQRDPVALAKGLIQEKPNGYHSDICDSALYAWRACYAYLETVPLPPPPPESPPERAEREAAQMRATVARRAEAAVEEDREWWGE